MGGISSQIVAAGGSAGSGSKVPYAFNGYNKFLDENGLPAITPPWGTLTAIDLNTGRHLWQLLLPCHEWHEKPGIFTYVN
ncbi:hypothetical protein [Niabella hirudinis]|uniref:hypothetical protein n=1 Tax=Niabella hirudinis TaxID=1285929 RepID=UPI003EBED5BA